MVRGQRTAKFQEKLLRSKPKMDSGYEENRQYTTSSIITEELKLSLPEPRTDSGYEEDYKGRQYTLLH